MLQAAIIGCGVIAPTHARALALDGRAEVAWAADPDAAARERIAASRRTPDWREALADPAVDLVCICTPHAQHAEQVLAALAAGKHVLCEKPLGITPDEVMRLAAAGEAAWRERRLVAAGVFQHRFNPLAARLRSLLAEGAFGAVRSATMDFRCSRTPAYYRSGPWRGRWDGEGGALLINQAIHTVDLLAWFCGEPVAVAAEVERRRLGDAIECEDWAKLRVRFAGGAAAELLAVNDGVTDWRTDIAVECERGAFALGGPGYGLTRLVHASQVVQAELQAMHRIRDEVVKLPGKSEYGSHHALQVSDAVSAILAGRRPRVTLADAAPAVQLALGAYASAAQGGAEIALPAAGWRRPVLTPSTVTV